MPKEPFVSRNATPEEKAFGRNILYFLTEKRKTINDLARKIGVHLGAVYSWVNGQLLPSVIEEQKFLGRGGGGFRYT